MSHFFARVLHHYFSYCPSTMLHPTRGNLLTATVDALVNPVNTEGVMGRGLALQFKQAFPEAFAQYHRDCAAGLLRPGQMHIVTRVGSPRFIIHFPTKTTWRRPSQLEYIQSGLVDLVEKVRSLKIQSIAIPPLGCGLGGLAWSDVAPLIHAAFAAHPEVTVLLFEP